MAQKKQNTTATVLVDVLYEDGTQRSNRKVPAGELSGFDDDAEIRQIIEAQDQKIAGLSGQSRPPIRSINRVNRR